MRILLILLLFMQSALATELAAVFEMPTNSKYNLVPKIAKSHILIKKETNNVKNTIETKEISIKLSGVFKVGNTYKALINGESYSINDKILGYKIKKIDINSATLIKKDKKVTVYVENN